MHRVEEIFALRVNADAEQFAFAPQTFFQFGGAFAGARGVGDDNHRKLSLHDRLVDIDNAAIGVGEYFRNARDDSGMVQTEDRDDHPVRRAFRGLRGRGTLKC